MEEDLCFLSFHGSLFSFFSWLDVFASFHGSISLKSNLVTLRFDHLTGSGTAYILAAD